MPFFYTRDSPAIPDRGPNLINMLWVLTSLAFLTVILRFIFRARKRQFGWDDFFMATTMACFIGWSAVLTLYANRGGCQHIWDVEKRGIENLTRVILLNWTSQIFGIVGVATGKISISALLLGIIRETEWRWQRYYLWAITIILASGVAISCCLLTFLQCNPPERLWDPRVPGKCLDPKIMSGYGTFTGSFNTFADASLAIIPLTIFWNLRMSMIEKIQLCIVFGLNILTSICSGIKTQYLAELSNRTDQTWATYDIFAWVTAELFLIIVCGTLPTLYPLLRAIQSIISSLKTKVSSNPSNTDDQGNNSSELLTIGKIRVRSRRMGIEDVTDGNGSEDQLNSRM
ncbi:hypothetical protein BS50DRAFT_527481 [Corynespora cassiicola Philippines]|uniref:Rhodopsin domain-containing protein n=1 Tax=Corynespora cassiicola Philippines TaxID=1448308 RepID=A0A2T2NJN0_CORCC|nr:hypothetical protein BS50DRAFT_527481 [Corynespora cassiicola Philippines]